MSAPLVVNTNDGAVWTRREGSRDGEALYAPEKCGTCPAFVMVTLTELAGLGIAGSADVLPVPVVPEPQALSPERLAEIREHVAETRNWSLGNLAARDLLAEVDRLRAERDEFCNRVDTLTAVAQGNKRHVVSLTTECQRLTAEVASLNKALDDAARALRERQAEREALVERMRAGQRWQRGRSPELVSENLVSQSELRSIFGIPLITPWDEPAEVPVPPQAESECACPPVDRPHQVGCPLDGVPDAVTRAFAPVASLREPEGEFDAFLRHPYRTGHDLPETGGM